MRTTTTALALITTADSGEERATITLLHPDGTESDKIDLGPDGYLTEAVDELRARGWRVYPDMIFPRRGMTQRERVGHFETRVFKG